MEEIQLYTFIYGIVQNINKYLFAVYTKFIFSESTQED